MSLKVWSLKVWKFGGFTLNKFYIGNLHYPPHLYKCYFFRMFYFQTIWIKRFDLVCQPWWSAYNKLIAPQNFFNFYVPVSIFSFSATILKCNITIFSLPAELYTMAQEPVKHPWWSFLKNLLIAFNKWLNENSWKLTVHVTKKNS